jgi:amino acid transporter
MSSIPAVFFAFDGFYSAAGIQTEMKEPKKVSMALAVGIAIVSAIDVLIAFSFLIGTGTGKLSDLHVPIQVIQVANVLVTVGILGVINGVAIYSSRYYEDLVAHNEIPFA